MHANEKHPPNRTQPGRLLTGKELRKLTAGKDKSSPSLKVFLLLEGLEWTCYLLLLWVALNFLRPVWQPVVSLLSGAQ